MLSTRRPFLPFSLPCSHRRIFKTNDLPKKTKQEKISLRIVMNKKLEAFVGRDRPGIRWLFYPVSVQIQIFLSALSPLPRKILPCLATFSSCQTIHPIGHYDTKSRHTMDTASAHENMKQHQLATQVLRFFRGKTRLRRKKRTKWGYTRHLQVNFSPDLSLSLSFLFDFFNGLAS